MIIVSNRLPVTVKKVDDKLDFHSSIGGLATGLASYTKTRKNMWIGWPGVSSEDLSEKEKRTVRRELAKNNCYPIFLNRKQIEDYYNGYSNQILWPLFHNLPVKGIKNSDRYWTAYKQVNKLFTEEILRLSKQGSTVWIHDFHLFLVPEMLRAKRPKDIIGHFLHIPFPPPNTFLKLPQAKRILQGLLGSDLVGFHTPDYVQNFLESCQELQIGTASTEQVIVGDRSVRVTNFPLGIDYEKFSQATDSTIVQKHIQDYKRKYGDYKVILMFDRLDPTKGFKERLTAYHEFLEQNTRFHGKVIMLMAAVPSRSEVASYRKLQKEVVEQVGIINKRFGKPGWQPIHEIYRTIPFEEVAALYEIADIAFIAPIRDGMNLIAKEYVATKANKNGVLILSETAGAAHELTNALLVDPKKPATLVAALSKAMTMRPRELKKRLGVMQKHLSNHTAHQWKRTFTKAMKTSGRALPLRVRRLTGPVLDQLEVAFVRAHNPAILLDYDGVLVPFFDKPELAKPSKSLMKLLQALADTLSQKLLLISGRRREDLDEWMGSLPVTLAAEHGAIIRPPGKAWKQVSDVRTGWKKLLRPVLQKYADKTPGAFVEEKEGSLVWHYRKAQAFYAKKNAVILERTLRPLLKQMGLGLYKGKMILEIKSPQSNKGATARKWLKTHDFILSIGDDYTDEDMFAALPLGAHTVKVGPGKTVARYRLNSVDEVLYVLERLVKAKQK